MKRIRVLIVVLALVLVVLVGGCVGQVGGPVDWEAVWGWVQSAQLPLILALIGLDVALGVSRAIKAGVFRWEALGDFYRTMVAPYVLTYLALNVLVGFVPELEGLVGEGIVSVAFGAITYNLLVSVVDHLQALGLKRQE